MHKEILVANKIPIALNEMSVSNSSNKELNELVGYLYCFLSGSIYHGNNLQVIKVINKMLINAHLSNNILSFSFPKKIRTKFCFNKKYCINLKKQYSAHTFYSNELMPKYRLACKIIVRATGKEQKFAIQRIQKIILDSPEHLKSISITKRGDDKCITTLKFKAVDKSNKVLLTKSITLAIYALQEVLAPE